MTSTDQALTLIHESSNSLIYHQSISEYGRPVVIKVLNADQPTADQLIRFNNEYEFTKDLVVDGVRNAIAQTRLGDKPALVLEYVAGQTLKQTFVEQRQSLIDFLRVAVHVTQALGELHQHHIIHRDINSYNVLVNPETKQTAIIDFGLATRLDLHVQHLGNPEGLAGTLAYISPEQTGRMNRVVDYRTDLYSLGVTFYEMLTGHLPFESRDPLALVHAHLAKAPRPVTTLNPNVPGILSDIVMRLLAKNAEDRYQSAFGLAADLKRCLIALRDSQDPESLDGLRFQLGQDDFSGRFHLLQKLYGRSTEIAALLATFERTAAGSQELILVTGHPGVGKSALVTEIHKPITEKRGHFISGKFDQYQRHTPYAAFSQAFNQLADLLLTEPASVLQQWRDGISAAVGGNGAVLVEVIPHLEQVIGSQPAVPKLGGSENRNRFNLTFQSFVQVLSTAEHPLVLFVDDWQWADSASLELLKTLLLNEVSSHLLLIGAYRDSEVDQTHPFMMTLNDLIAAGCTMQTIQLSNLQVEDVQQLIQESLTCSTADSQALTELVYEKTQGNAFFTRQFLQNLYEEGWLHFDVDTRCWMWDIAQIKAQNITDNVVKLMVGKLGRLSQPSIHSLQLAACIGNEFDLQTLALINQASEISTLASLEEALTQGLVIPLDEYYQLPDTAGQACFRFLHDRVQQAAYAQIPTLKQQTIHLEVGRLLLANTPAADLEHRIFDIVQHYNQASALVTDENERLCVAELNMQAADLAYESAAFPSARVYLDTALAFMPRDAWDNHYDRMLGLHSQLATTLYLTGDFERLDQIVQTTEAQAHTLVDTAQVKLARIQYLLSSGNLAEAIESSLNLVQDMGISFNRSPSLEQALAYLQETGEWLTEARLETLLHLPEAPAEIGMIYEIAVTINGPIYGSDMALCLVFVSRITRLCFEQGVALWSPVTLATFALMLDAALHDIPQVRLLTDLALQLYEERYHSDSLVASLGVAIGGFILHHYDHLKRTLPLFAEGIQKGLASGAFEFVAFCAWWYGWHHLFLGIPLAKVEVVVRQAVETCQKVQMERLRDWSSLVHQATLNLQGKNEAPWILKGDAYDVDQQLALALQINDFAEVFRILFYKAWLHYMFDQPQVAAELFQEAESHLMYGAGLYLIPLYHFYDALANAAVYANHTTKEQAQILERIDHSLEQLEVWVRFAPMNHKHKQDLMEAEKARIEGKYWEAVQLYQKAIRGARENEFLNEEALAHELYGKFWLEQGHQETATVYLHKAQNLYTLWEAVAKVKQLQARYGPEIGYLQVRPQDTLETTGVTPTVRSSTSSRTVSKAWLDLASILKASQNLSQTVQLTDLLSEMLKILLENAGAEKAFVMYQTEDAWFIEASGQVQDQLAQTMMHVPLSEATMLSQSVCNYVIRSGQSIVLDNAAEDPQFATDDYLQAQAVKSVLCLPVWHQGKLELVLYLENDLVEGAFTEDRLELLRLLSGQMAISLENALTVDRLKTSIIERERAEKALRENEERLTALAIIANELSKVQTLDELYRRSVEAGREQLGFDRVALWFFAEDHTAILGTYGTDAEGSTTDERASRHPIDETSGLRAIADGDIGFRIYRTAPLYQDGTEIGAGERLAVGLWDGEAVIGFLSVDNLIRRQPFTDRDCELLRLYAVSLGHLINLKRAQDELARLAETLEQRVVQRTAQLEAANTELEAFSYSVSHDLRAPLRAIDGYTRILTEDYQATLDDNGRRVCGVIRSQTQRMGQLIDDLLAFSRLGRTEIKTSLIDMQAMAHSVFYGLTTPDDRERIEFRVVPLPPAVGDPTLIGQVWANLLGNACKFSAKRERVVISVGGSQEGAESIYYVRDNGAGFDMQYADKLFGVFQRLHSEREFDGTGVGLAIVQRIVHRHGGRVWAEAEVGKGATFYFALPRQGN